LKIVYSKIVVVPKPDGNWRLNTNLSHPPNKGMHSYIDYEFCKVNYSSLDSILEMIYNCGKSAELSKIDIKSAFRLANYNEFQLPTAQNFRIFQINYTKLNSPWASICLYNTYYQILFQANQSLPD
jgi:hypothetical protein